MCDYSLESVLSRQAKVGDRLTTRLFRTQYLVAFLRRKTSMLQFALLPGTELSLRRRS